MLKLPFGFLSNVYGQAITLAIQILSVPIFVTHWGLEGYGHWVVLTGIQGYFTLADFGMMAATMNHVTSLDSKSAEGAAKRLSIYSAGMCFAFGLFFSITVLAGVTIHWLLVPREVIGVEGGWTLLLLIMYALANLLNSLIDASFRIENKYAQGTVILETVRLVEWGVSMATLVLLDSMPLVALSLFLGRAASMVIILVYMRMAGFQLRPALDFCDYKEFFRLFPSARSWLYTRLADISSVQGVALAIAHTFSVRVAAEFAAYRTIGRLTLQFTSAISNASWPKLSKEVAERGVNAAGLALRKNIVFTAAIAIGLSVLLLPSFGFILERWTRGSIAYNSLTGLFVVMSTLALAINYAIRIALMVVGRLNFFGQASLVTSLVIVCVIAANTAPLHGLASVFGLMLAAEFLVLMIGLKKLFKT